MSSTIDTLSQHPGARGHLMVWASGRRPATRASRQVVVSESAAASRELITADLITSNALTFAPDGGEAHIPFDGSIATVGTEFTIGDEFFLQVQGYGISEYLSVVGPTLVRVSDDEDVAALRSDAVTALSTGSFPEFLTNPIIQLADVPAFGLSAADAGPRDRLWIGADGIVRVTPDGDALGTPREGLDAIVHEWQRIRGELGDVTALSRVISDTETRRGLQEDAGLRRFVQALDGLRNLRARRVPLPRVSGFGGTLLPGLEPSAASEAANDAPFIMWSDDRRFLVSVDGARVFEIDHAHAEAFDAILHSASLDAAAEQVGLGRARAARDMLEAQRLIAPAEIAA